MIGPDLTLARLLEEHPALLAVLAGFHPHFKQLEDPQVRRVMAPRVTVAEAARMAGVPPGALLAALRRAAGQPEGGEPEAPAQGEARGEGPRPAALEGLPVERQVHVDVRDDIRRSQEPFGRIMAAVRALGPEQVLILRAPFEPLPLYDVLGKRGLAHWTERHAADDWSVWFYRAGAPAAPAAAVPAPRTVLDVRGLEPPEPMVRVLEALDRLPPGGELEVLHARRPMFLYPQLDERGFAHTTEEAAPGLVRILIRRAAPAP